MSRTVYRKDRRYVADIAACAVQMSDPYEVGLSPRRKALIRAMRQRVSPRQLECLTLYYARHISQEEIARTLGIHISTVSRNIKRGESNIKELLDLEKIMD